MKIRVLSDVMASRIAAGEVVERPASVVKELIENSLDAGATEIFVEVEKSGAAAIRVSDNGEGMGPEDLALAVERHATSKLREEADLWCISTLGFRGEALPSIASVAKLTIQSRPRGAASGHRLVVVGGRKGEIAPAATSFGTMIEARELFFNTPARKKFLKSAATELSHICDAVNRMALAYPKVHFRLQHDGRNLADYVAVGDGSERLHQVLGRDTAGNLAVFSRHFEAAAIRGYLSAAPVSYPNARHVYTFVNGRYVRDRVLTHALLFGYETLLMKGQYPAAVVFLEVSFAEVDVNVHPAKYEVRFRRQSEIHEALSRAVREALRREARQPAARRPDRIMVSSAEVCESALLYSISGAINDTTWTQRPAQVFAMPARAERANAGFFSSLQVLGQLFGCFLVCASSDEFLLIDQHAAHERVAFENLRRQLALGRVERQRLLMPQYVDLTAGEMLLLEKKLDMMEAFGFSLEPFGPHSYAVTAGPVLLPASDYAEVIRRMVAELAEVDSSDRLRQHLEERLATLACHSVIRANRKLQPEEIRALLEALDGVDYATQCPHGRPVLIQWSREQLDRLFKRVV